MDTCGADRNDRLLVLNRSNHVGILGGILPGIGTDLLQLRAALGHENLTVVSLERLKF